MSVNSIGIPRTEAKGQSTYTKLTGLAGNNGLARLERRLVEVTGMALCLLGPWCHGKLPEKYQEQGLEIHVAAQRVQERASHRQP
jgi:hypothetical protein